MRKILIFAAASIVAQACFGQTPDFAPSAEMKKLDFMVGEWTSVSTWSMEGMAPTKVTTSVKIAWDGQFLRQTTLSDYEGQFKMTETAMLGYDPAKKQYFSSAYTNVSPMPRTEHGTFDGTVMLMTSDPWEVMGDATTGRATLTKVSNDEMKFKLEFKMGDKWVPVTEGSYIRKKS